MSKDDLAVVVMFTSILLLGTALGFNISTVTF